MKDARGHGSDKTNGISVINPNGGNIAPKPKSMFQKFWDGSATQSLANDIAGGGRPMSSNAEAAQSLMSGLKSTQAPVHDAMAFRAGRASDNAALKQRSKEFSDHLDDPTYAGTGPKPAHWK
jgi:hypothetical protein